MLWKCPNCETLNEGESCFICGEKMPERKEKEIKPNPEPKKKIEETSYKFKSYPEPRRTEDTPKTGISGMPVDSSYEEKPHKKSPVGKLIVAICIVLVILTAVLLAWIGLENSYNKGVNAFYDDDFETAIESFESISFYRDSKDMLAESFYQQGLEYMDEEKWKDAKKSFEEIKWYDDAKELSEDCAYYEAVEYYSEGDYENAMISFKNLNGEYDASDYITLIEAKDGSLSDVSALIDLVGFEDANEIIAQNGVYLIEYMLGDWGNSYGKEIKFTRNNSSTQCDQNIGGVGYGEYYLLENGEYKVGDGDTYKTVFSIEIVDEDEIEVYSAEDRRYHTLYRNY